MTNITPPEPRVYVAAQEIGGWNLLQHYVSKLSSQIYFNLEPPAKGVDQTLSSISTKSMINELKTIDKVFVAASIDNRNSQTLPLYLHTRAIETDFIISLDNWVYFPERLVGIGPTHLIVYDVYAFNYAKAVFGDFHNVSQVRNYYLEEICLQVSRHRSQENSWLFVDARPNLFTNFDQDLHENGCCCTQIKAVIEKGGSITFRPHPGFRRNSCENYLSAKYDGRFQISNEKLLYRDLFNHSHVLGSPGYALYVASQAGKQVFSTASTNSEWNGPIFERLSDQFM